jgi:hypothetical protein
MLIRSILPSVLLPALLAGLADAQRAQTPNEDLRRRLGTHQESIAADPYFNGNMLGLMPRPKGRLKRVTWFGNNGFGGLDMDPPGWEKRVVQAFDDAGRCIELEEWEMGELNVRHACRPLPTGEPGAPITWESGWRGACWRTEHRRNASGRLHETVWAPLDANGTHPTGADPLRRWTYEYDPAGHLTNQRIEDQQCRLLSAEEWRYDPRGRVSEQVDCTLTWGPCTQEFEYDDRDRVQVEVVTYPGQEPLRVEYRYEAESARVAWMRVCRGGIREQEVACRYDSDARLIERATEEFQLEPQPGSPRSRSIVEIFGGEDRPLLREVFGKDGRVLERTCTSYVDDSRGNWTHKTSISGATSGEFTVWRRIEYAD